MILDRTLWDELVEIGVLTGDETCLRCFRRPQVLWDTAHAPLLLCRDHARELQAGLIEDLRRLGSIHAPPAAGGHERR